MSSKSRRLGVDGKPTIDIQNAWVDDSMGKRRYFLWGYPENHPTESFNGTKVHTGFIKAVRGNLVETANHVYNVLSWDENKTPVQQLELF